MWSRCHLAMCMLRYRHASDMGGCTWTMGWILMEGLSSGNVYTVGYAEGVRYINSTVGCVQVALLRKKK